MIRPDRTSIISIGVFVAIVIILVYCGRLLQSQTAWLKALDVKVDARDARWEAAIIRTEEAQHRILELLRKQELK